MKFGFLGRTGVRVSKLAFGTMSFLGDADRETSIAMFHAAREAGINLFDCADVYNGGQSEELLGELVKGCRDQVIVTTKAHFPTSDDVNGRGLSRYHLVRSLEGSLRRLRMDYVDIFFFHRFDDETALEESLRAAGDLVRQGKALYVGVSNFSAWQTMKAHGIAEREGLAPIVCCQPMYNLVKRQAEVEILPMALSEGIGVIPYSPLGGGLFSGKYGEHRRAPEGRLSKSKMYMARYADPSFYRIAEAFARLAGERGHHPAALAAAWCGAHPAVTAPIIGSRSLDQLRPVLGATDIDMTPELYDAISALSPTPGPATDRNEEKTEHNYGRR